MSEKIFKQFFARDFKGIDGLTSSLEEDVGGFNRAVNLEMSVGNSLRGRVGCQIAGMTGSKADTVASSSVFSGRFFGIFPYSYTRTQDQYDIRYQVGSGVHPNQTPYLAGVKTTADGASVTKLIGINQQAWVLDTMSIVVTYSSGTYPFTWYSTVSGGTIHFIIKANGVTILDLDCGDGINSNTSIYTALGQINALAELNITRTTRNSCPPYGISSLTGATTAVGTVQYGSTYSFTCSAYNFVPGDIVTFPTSPVTAGMVLATAGATVTYVGPQVTLTTGDILGYMNQTAAAFPITTAASASSGNLTLTFPYWRLLPEGSYNFGHIFDTPYLLWTTATAGSYFMPPTSVSSLGCLYLGISGRTASNTDKYTNSLIKTDGQTLDKAGLSAPISITPTATAGGALTGVYKYKYFIRRYDAQGNITDGPLSPVATVTYTAQYGAIATNPGYIYGGGSSLGYGGRSCYKYTTEAPAAGQYFYIDDNTAAPGNNGFMAIGDPVCLTDNTAQKVGLWHFAFGVDALGTLHRTVCTNYDPQTPSAITVADSSGYTIPNNSEISAGLTGVFLRTTAGGNQYYVLCEIPITGYAAPSFFDNVTDAVLGAGVQFTEPTLGKEHDPPPPCSLVCDHQGGLVVARGYAAPNTVGFSSADGLEYFPTASNTFDVPSKHEGYITAIASDTNDRLAVFKDRSYFDVAGDLDGGNFSVNIKHDGDYGIVSQRSLQRIEDSLIGLSRNGFVVVHDGFLDSQKFADLNTRLINQTYLFQFAVSENDYFNRNYICSIPTTSSPVSLVIDYSRGAIKTFERSFANTQVANGGGMAMVGDTLFHLSQTSPFLIYRRLPRFNGDSPSGNGDGDSFIHNTAAIPYILESNPINFGEPAQLKEPLKIRLWSLPNDYVNEGWVAHSTLIEGGASAIATYVGSGSPLGTSSTVTFATANDAFKDVLLKKGKTLFYIVRLTTNTVRTAPFWTGYEIAFAQAYDKEDLIK